MKHKSLMLMLFFIGATIFAAGFGLAWFSASQLEGETVIYVLACAGLLLLGISSAISTFIQSYIAGTQRLIHETTFMTTTDPAYRSQLTVPADMYKLAQNINTLADLYQGALTNQAKEMQYTQKNLEEEHNRLNTLLSELSKGERALLEKLSTALEILEQGPDMEFGTWFQLRQIIQDVTSSLNSQLTTTLSD